MKLKTPELQPTEPRLTRDQAAAAWFLFLETAQIMMQGDTASVLIAKASLILAKKSGESIRRATPALLESIIKDNAQSSIIV